MSRATMQFTLYGEAPVQTETRWHQGSLLVSIDDSSGHLCISGPPERVRALLQQMVAAAGVPECACGGVSRDGYTPCKRDHGSQLR